MAIKATVFKAELRIADMGRGYYRDHTVTVARHPSETDERMMVRLLAFALNADDNLAFGAGLSTDDEPDLWRRDLTGRIETWIDVGLPDEKRIRKACGRAGEVRVYSYGGRAADLWWRQVGDRLSALGKLTVINLPQAGTQALALMVARNMQLQYTIQEGQVWMANGRDSVQIEPQTILASGTG
ncbi:MAG TPA: YaeQ family protein [Burkholderiales bacterium]|nr:YaeQ family protein [Burkholderiales bacterium]